jgi:hypothetical protein
LNPKIMNRVLKDSGAPVKLAALVACDTLDELYHGLYDASLISALRTVVFAGIVTDAIKKTVENLEVEEEEKVDKIIQSYFEYRNQRVLLNTLQNQVDSLQEEIEKN